MLMKSITTGENLRHPCHPLEEWMQLRPEKPTRYREIVGRYSVEVRKLSMRILDLICGGLGLEPGYFGDELHKVQALSVNHYQWTSSLQEWTMDWYRASS